MMDDDTGTLPIFSAWLPRVQGLQEAVDNGTGPNPAALSPKAAGMLG